MSLIVKALSLALAAAQSPAPVQTGPLTLEQAAAIAERNAFAVRLQQSRIEQNRQRVEEAKAGLLPRANGSFVVNRLPNDQVANFGGAPVVTQKAEQRTISGGVTFPIDIFGNAQRQVQAGRANLRASRRTLEAARNDIRLNAKTAFLNVLRAQAAVGVAEQAVRDSTERLEQSRKLLAGEQVARVDVIRLEAQLAASEADLVTARNNLELQRYALNQALARPIETPVEVVDVPALPTAPSDATPLVQSAQQSRAEVLALFDTLEALGYSRRALEGGLQPSLSIGVNYQRNLDVAGFAQKEQTVANLTLNIPVFDGGATRARVRAARQDEEQARINLEQTQLNISQEVRNAVTSLVNTRARLASAEAQVRSAEEVYRLARVRQDAAEGTYVEVVDALTQLIQARNAVVSARYDYLVAFSQLQRAVGSDDLTGAPSTPNGGGSR
ncbi:MAG: TolC family protein [Fimbriimonas sp.]